MNTRWIKGARLSHRQLAKLLDIPNGLQMLRGHEGRRVLGRTFARYSPRRFPKPADITGYLGLREHGTERELILLDCAPQDVRDD